MYETAEDEMSPEMHDISDRGFEEAANLMLTLCQQNEMEKHRKSREIQRHIETETRRAIWYIVEDGILGERNAMTSGTRTRKMRTAPRSFASRSMNGWRSFSICSRKMFGYASGEMGDELPLLLQVGYTSARVSYVDAGDHYIMFGTSVMRLRSPFFSCT